MVGFREWARALALFGLVGIADPALADTRCSADAPFSAANALTEVHAELRSNYAYWDRINADQSFDIASTALLSSPDRTTFADRLEALLMLFEDSHLHVTPTTEPAMAWIPSAADLWFTQIGSRYVVRDVKDGSLAAERGIRPGWELVQIEGQEPLSATEAKIAPIGIHANASQKLYALNALGAGRIKQNRNFIFRSKGKRIAVTLPPGYTSVRRASELLTVSKRTDPAGHLVAVIRFNNSLGNNALIAAFDDALSALPIDSHIVLDLRDTPGGGNSTVARAIVGHFIAEIRPYQRHELTAERVQFGVPRIWVEYAAPRAIHRQAPVVLAGLWTGSMGEGLAIGLNGAAGSAVVGSSMGRLLGAIVKVDLPMSCLSISYANEKLWHVDGRPREAFLPDVLLEAADTPVDGGQKPVERAIAIASQSDRQKP